MAWFEDPKELKDGETICGYMSTYVKRGTNVLVTPFMQFGLNIVKDLVATALVESMFSVVALMKSKGRCALNRKMLVASLVMRQELFFFDPTLSFPELWSKMKPWLVQRGEMKSIRRKYRTHRKSKTKVNTLHASSNEF